MCQCEGFEGENRDNGKYYFKKSKIKSHGYKNIGKFSPGSFGLLKNRNFSAPWKTLPVLSVE